tara:strand:- start:1159 stop:2610 length:1452 start_codon:yes stop_codon:yes gene_type:complete
MAKINFTAGTQKYRKLKRAPKKYSESGGRPNVSMSDGRAPAYPMVPYKYLPVAFQDINTEDWVVIPKGRLVSAVLSSNTAWTSTWNTGAEAGLGLGDDNAFANNGSEVVNTKIVVDSDGSYHGVSKNIKGLLVPANGGAEQILNYDADDVGTTPKSAGDGYVADGDTITMGANAPIGIVEHDVYQDIRGANLNYDMRNKNWGVLAQQFIKLPFVDTAAWASAGVTGVFVDSAADAGSGASTQVNNEAMGDFTENGTNADGQSQAFVLANAPSSPPVLSGAAVEAGFTADWDGSTGFTVYAPAGWAAANPAGVVACEADYFYLDASSPGTSSLAPSNAAAFYAGTNGGYKGVYKKNAFLTFDSSYGQQGLAGNLLTSDCFGNWKVQDGGWGAKTAQTAGRLLGVDTRFTKDLLDTVQNRYEDEAAYRVAGTGTFGVPQYLYSFAYDALSGASYSSGSDDMAKKIKDFCDAGVFGEAWIQLNCQN